MTVLGISSSPIRNGNVDRMVKFILENSGKPFEFINLTELSYSPCRACVHLCARDNLCRLEDDL
ncbi:MAG TPA: flavodoxin family protein, partial [Deltaproteobacteria bacterium]|nr:flavodoxin family protein [Deltaproteobacteria bacterium]